MKQQSQTRKCRTPDGAVTDAAGENIVSVLVKQRALTWKVLAVIGDSPGASRVSVERKGLATSQPIKTVPADFYGLAELLSRVYPYNHDGLNE